VVLESSENSIEKNEKNFLLLMDIPIRKKEAGIKKENGC